MKYAHTNIIATDWRKLAAFYKSVFDCVPVPPLRSQSGEWLSRGTGVQGAAIEGAHLRLPGFGENGPTLEIYQYSEVIEGPTEPRANRQGYGHLAFLVDDVAAVREKVLAHGGAEVGKLAGSVVPDVGELTFVYLADPEGNILEIQSWKRGE